MPKEQQYRCVCCDQNTLQAATDRFVCAQCGAIFPVIDGVPVLTRRAPHFVVAQAKELTGVNSKWKQLHRELTQLNGIDNTPMLSKRALRMADGMAANIVLMEEQCQAIWTYAKSEAVADDTIAWATAQNGYPFDELLPYFYQDWYGTKPFADVLQNVVPAVEAFCDDRHALAVFGAGACGLLYELSGYFEKSVGVDLALPGLIMAKHLIEGERLSLCLEKADWADIALSPPANNNSDTRFMAANVMDTPFPDKSLSVVVTQYLIDIVPNAAWFAHEIRRILKPGGVWINFSKPFTWPSDHAVLGPRRLPEIMPILHEHGFEELQLKMSRFNVLSTEDIYPGGERFDQEVHIFAAKKADDNMQVICPAIKGRIRKKPTEAWNQVPKLVGTRQIAVVEKKIFKTGLQETVPGIQVMDSFIPMERAFLSAISILLECMDGHRTLRQLKDHMDKQGVTMPERDFLDLIYCLNVEYYLLKFDDKR